MIKPINEPLLVHQWFANGSLELLLIKLKLLKIKKK